MTTDEELIELLSLDEEEALKGIYRKYWEALSDYAFSLTGDEAQSKDIVQEVFLRVMVKDYLKGIQTSLKSYLFLTVKRDCVRFLRTQLPTETLDNSFDQFLVSTHTEHSAHPMMLKELEFHYEKELAGLPPRLKEVFELSRKQGFNSKEISLQLGLSDQTVKNQITHVLRILRGKLQMD